MRRTTTSAVECSCDRDGISNFARRAPVLAFVAAALALVAAPAFAQATLENDVKATFLYNFTKFIEWPPSAASEGTPLRLCVLADAEFTRAVDRTIAGESVDGRPLGAHRASVGR